MRRGRRRASENLAHLLTGYPAARSCTSAAPAVSGAAGRLEEAVERYADTDPIAVRHIEYALGRDAARTYKNDEVKEGRRENDAEERDLRKAVKQLDAARAPDKEREEHAFEPLTLSDVALRLASCHAELGQNAKAATVLESTAKELKALHGSRSGGRPRDGDAGDDAPADALVEQAQALP